MTNKRINQIDQVALVVRHTPGCVLQDICEALDITSSSAANLLRKLATSGRVNRDHNGTQYTYTVAPGADIPDVMLPYMLEKQDPEQLQIAERIAKELESRGLWRRAATVYTDILSLAANSREVLRIAQRRDACLRTARR